MNEEYLTEHWLYNQCDDFQNFIDEQRKRLNEQLKNVKPIILNVTNNS